MYLFIFGSTWLLHYQIEMSFVHSPSFHNSILNIRYVFIDCYHVASHSVLLTNSLKTYMLCHVCLGHHKMYLVMYILRVTTHITPVEPTFLYVNKVNAVSCRNVHLESTQLIGCCHVIELSMGVQSAPNIH